jgi:hypothetical protein
VFQFVSWALFALAGVGSAPPQNARTAKPAQPSHQQNWATTRNPHGPTLTIPCENCHRVTAWRPIKANPEFDHNKTRYPLRGMHEKVQCTQCHVKPVFTDVGKNCQDCHTDVHRRRMGANCAECHTVQGWKIAVQQVKDHQNRFPLLGAHAAAQCDDCHKSAAVGQFQGLSTACISCHQRDLQQTQTLGGSVPNHIAAQFPQTCETCHTFDSWLGATINHAGPPINFPLTAGHANVPCESCHVGGNYNLQIAATDCGHAGCHLTTWQQTTNPAHSASPTVFPIATCSNCHVTVSWLNATFDHSTTGFPLTNSHQMAPAGKVNACTDCHINNNYNLTIQPNDCGNSGCHLTTWQQTNNPTHSAAGTAFAAANCATCHNTTLWTNATFDHTVTGWPLVGSHQMAPAGKVAACTDCHVNNNYNFTSANTDCYGCHQAAWNSTPTFGGSVPNHITAGFPTSLCSQCHDTIVWTDSTFNHANTGFPLTNAHQIAPAGKVTGCDQCHLGNYSTLAIQPTDCGNAQCHLTTWQQTNNPTHSASPTVFPVASCSTCHNTITWTTATFDHSTTGFPLTNSHQMAPAGKVNACTDCHINNNYNLTIQPNDCGNSGCHLTTWQQTNNPTHSTAGTAFAAANCSNCHNTIAWTTATFDHSTTGWPLTGSHQMAPAGKVNACTDCHVNSNYNFTSANTDCYGCHQAAWNSTPTFGGSVPNHITAGFPTSLCSTCHDTVLWSDGKFDHSTTGFPLQGPHMLPPRTTVTGAIGAMVNACTDCHISSNYTAGYPTTDCYGCHQSYYTNAQTYDPTVPNHVAANYPTTCITCHTTWVTTAWLGAVFNHTAFRIPHPPGSTATTGSICSNCHINATNYQIFSCIMACHGGGDASPHTSQTTTNTQHTGVSGYTYNATICVNCHKS